MEKPTTEDLLKAIGDVIDEALITYEEVKKAEGIDAAEAIDDMKSQGKAIVGEGEGEKPAMAKEEDAEEKPEDKLEDKEETEKADGSDPADSPDVSRKVKQLTSKAEDKEEEKEDEDKKEVEMPVEKSDDELIETYKSLVATMEERGLFQKAEEEDKEEEEEKEEDDKPVEKSETISETDTLRKSVDERFDTLTKAIAEIGDAVKKIAAAPVGRRGVTGYAPLKKSEDAPTLKKSEVVSKLLELKKSDQSIDSLFINRVETGRASAADVERIKKLGILGE